VKQGHHTVAGFNAPINPNKTVGLTVF